MRTAILIVISCSTCCGCGLLSTPGHEQSGWGVTPSSYPVECRDVPGFGVPGGELVLDLAAPIERQVIEMACMTKHATPGAAAERPYVWWHMGFDERRFDPLKASMIVINCTSGTRCEYPYVVGQVEYYARQATPDGVAAAFETVGVSPGVRDAYLERYTAAREQLRQATVRLSGSSEASLLLEVPRRVRAERAAYFNTMADDLDAFDALVPRIEQAIRSRSVSDDLYEEAEGLRDRHVLRCIAETPFSTYLCWNGTFARPLTRALAWLAVLADRPVAAYVEADTLDRGADLNSAAVQIAMSQIATRDDGRSYTWDPWPAPPSVSDGDLNEAVHAMFDRLDWIGEELVAASIHGRTARLRFRARVSSSTDYECSDRIVARIDASGMIRLHRPCRAGRTVYERHDTRPVIVPTADAQGLNPGNFVVVVFDPTARTGRVSHARPSSDSRPEGYHRLRFTPISEEYHRDRRAALRVPRVPSTTSRR